MVHVFQIDPVPASRPRVSKYGTYYLPTYRAFKKQMQELVAKDHKKFTKAEGPLSVAVWCCIERPKTTKRDYPTGDVDNYAKAVLDSLNGVLWDDDDQILELVVRKSYCDDDKPYIFVEVNADEAIQSHLPAEMSKMRKQRKGSKCRQSSRVR
jgi:Holliday junction resolvase RusA-like endonuclease